MRKAEKIQKFLCGHQISKSAPRTRGAPPATSDGLGCMFTPSCSPLLPWHRPTLHKLREAFPIPRLAVMSLLGDFNLCLPPSLYG
jgi:hypothetical protein